MTENKYEHLVVIGIQGAARSGKSLIRERIVEKYGGIHVTMAGPLKRGLIGMGATEDEIYGYLKQVPNELWGGKTNRFAMQTIGTEWGRETIHQDIWVNCVHLEIERLYQARVSNPVVIVIDDLRFPNEAAMVKEFGGVVWTIRRPEVEYPEWKQWVLKNVGLWAGALIGIHKSERWWAVAPMDGMFWNEGSKDLIPVDVDVVMEDTFAFASEPHEGT